MQDEFAIGVVGVGWVGLVTATCFAEIGHEVVARDIVAEKVESLSRGEVTIHEPRIADLLERNSERLTFTTSMDELLERCRVLFVCVDTPPTASGDADLSRVRSVVEGLPLGSDHIVVMKSTVPAGTGQAIRRDRPDLRYVSCPEFLKEGSAVDDFLDPDRVVIGADPGDEAGADEVAALYEPLGGEIVRTDVASAEMIKLGSNAFLATKISFINEIANVCEEVGADVAEVARGMGLDERIGPAFLRAGIGYGGSCFGGDEKVLARHSGTVLLTTFEGLWERCGGPHRGQEAIEPDDLWVWSWVPGERSAEWMPVTVLTKRDYAGELVEVKTKMGRTVTVTADHPFIVGDGHDDAILTHVLASELTTDDWLPLAVGPGAEFTPQYMPTVGVVQDSFAAEDVIMRCGDAALEKLRSLPVQERAAVLDHPRGHAQRFFDIKKSGAMRLQEACAVELPFGGASFSTVRNGAYVPERLEVNDQFWRVVGLYLAEGHVSLDRSARNGTERERIAWSFHPSREEHLVREVQEYWESQGVKVSVNSTPTTRQVSISSKILSAWWTGDLGLGRNSYEQRMPDLIWEQSSSRKRALLSGLWEGDGSWSLVNGGPSIVLEYGTISDRLAEGTARLLGDLGIVCSWRRGKTSKSTKITHWLRVAGADQVEQALFLVPEKDRPGVETCLGRQAKRIAPTGYRRFEEAGMPWVRVVETRSFEDRRLVYSLEVQGSHTVVTSGGLVASNCFPKDVTALKQLAGNSGYHFQLLTAVIEVNELQKRRVIGKLTKHLGSLAGKRIALLGLAFKPNTDDMRQASSIVLSARRQGAGAQVVAYDPVASGSAAAEMPGVEMAGSAMAAVEGADAVVLVTEWEEFARLDWEEAARAVENPLLVDGRNYLDPERLARAGFTYEGIGRIGEPPAEPLPAGTGGPVKAGLDRSASEGPDLSGAS